MSKRAWLGGQSGFYLYLAPGLVGFAAIVLGPEIANLGISLTAWKGIGTPRFVGFDNYVRLLHDAQFWGSLHHTLLFIVSMTVIPTLVGLILAAVLFDIVARTFGQPLASIMRAGFYLPQILPLTAAGVLWGWILSPIGIVNTVLRAVGLSAVAQNWLGDPNVALAAVSLVIVWVQLGYSLVVFMAGMSRIDTALYEAAQVDGANWWQRFGFVTVPMLAPEIFVVVLTTLIAALKVFAPIYVLTNGGPNDATMVPSYLTYYHFFTTSRVGYAAAVATIQSLFTIVLGIVFLAAQSKHADGEDN